MDLNEFRRDALQSSANECVKPAEGTNTAIIGGTFRQSQTRVFSLERCTNGETKRLLGFLQVEILAESGSGRLKTEVAGPTRREHAARDRASRGDDCVQGQRIVRVVNPERLLHDG